MKKRNQIISLVLAGILGVTSGMGETVRKLG